MTALLIVGGLLTIVGAIWLLVVTFQISVLWGVGSLLLPLVGLIFVFKNWQATKKPFLIQIAGLVLIIIAVIGLGPDRVSSSMPV